MAMTLEQEKALALARARLKAAGGAAAPSAPQPEPAKPFDLADALSAGFTSGVEAIPFVGPSIMHGLESAKAAFHGTTPEVIAAEDQQMRDDNQIASGVGSVAGTVVPFIAAGGVPLLARGLGMTGSLASRMTLGALSGAGIGAGDTAIRGGDTGEIATSAALGGGLGMAFPAAERGIGWLRGLVTGTGASKEAQNVARALRDDGVDPAQAAQKMQELGPDAMMMDLGPNLQAQAGALASVPGPGQKIVREAVMERAKPAAKTSRVAEDITQTIGDGPEVGALKEGIVKAQKAAADPLYAKVRNIPLENLPELAAVARTPMGKKALRQALDMMANDGIEFTDGQFTVGLADYMKQALDDVASAAIRGGENNIARQARNMTKAITGAVDRIVPEYKAARDAYAGPAQVLDAIDMGMTVFSKEMSPAQLGRELSSLSASERDAVLQGAQAQIEAMMGNAVNDVATLRNTFAKGWNEGKLRMLLGDDIADDLLKRIDRELTYGNTTNVVARNSETARRQASQAEVDPRTGTVSQPGKTFLGLIFDAFNAARNAISGVRQPQINAGMGKLLSAGAGTLSPAMIRQLQNAAKLTAPSKIAPAVGGLLTGPNKPFEITINGGGLPAS